MVWAICFQMIYLDKITHLNWVMREEGDIYGSVESQSSKEMGLI